MFPTVLGDPIVEKPNEYSSLRHYESSTGKLRGVR